MQHPPRSYTGPVLVILATTVGLVAVVFVATTAVMQLASVAATTAVAIKTAVPTLVGGSGIGLALRLDRRMPDKK